MNKKKQIHFKNKTTATKEDAKQHKLASECIQKKQQYQKKDEQLKDRKEEQQQQ